MSLRSLVFLAAITYTLIIGGSLLGYRLLIVYPQIERSSLELHKNDIKAIYTLYHGQKDTLMHFNLDWAKWDESYEFIKDGNESFIKRNIGGSFLESGIDALAFITNAGEIRYAGIKSGNEFKRKVYLNHITSDLDPESLIKNSRQFGFIRVNGELGYFASAAIQNSEETFKSNGILIFITILKQEFFSQINLITDAKVTLQELSNIKNMHFDEEPFLNETDIHLENIRRKYHIWTTNHVGEPIGIMEIKFPKTSIPKAMNTTTLLSILSLLALPIFITGVIWIIFLKPVSGMFKQLQRMSTTGQVKKIKNNSYITEFQLFKSTFNELADKITSHQNKLKTESEIDGLTNIYNRRYFDNAFDKIWRTSIRNHTQLAIIMMDIDYFKKYNDLYGHQQGDNALISVAQALIGNVRRANEMVARYGGEEFVMICQPSDKNELETILNKLLNSVRSLNIPHKDSEVSSHLTISCGACYIKRADKWLTEHQALSLKIADQALYKSKNAGRDQYRISNFDSAKENQ